MTLFSTFYFELPRSSTANFFGTLSSVTVTVLKTGLIYLVFIRYPGQNCESIDSDVSKLKVNKNIEIGVILAGCRAGAIRELVRVGRLAGETFIGLRARAGLAGGVAAVETESICIRDEGVFSSSLEVALESQTV